MANNKPEAPKSKIEQVSFADRLKESLDERDPEPFTRPSRSLRAQTRRDFLLLGAGAALTGAGLLYSLPEDVLHRLGLKHAHDTARKNRILDKSIAFDDAVAAALYSQNRRVPTFDKKLAQTPAELINNYNGPTPDGDYLNDWRLTLTGLASGKPERLSAKGIENLIDKHGYHEQVTQLTCVEGWRAIAWWGGLRFADLLAAYPPHPEARWARLDSSVNLGTDDDGNPISDPYYVAVDLPTARNLQTLLATTQSGQPLNLDHGAPLRLIAPMKLGLKNIKAITKISYHANTPEDYWNKQGYSQYDGV